MPVTPLTNQTGHIFLTGITGTVGCEIGRWLRVHAAGYRVTALIRAASAAELAARWREVLDSTGGGGTAPQSWRAVAGDVTLAGLGLDADHAAELQRTVTHIIHGAADVRFVAPLADARKINVEGTRNVLLFGARCKKLARFAHLSTLFVAGRRTGKILEGELESDAGFVNTYEQSKYEAEVMVRSFHGELPVAVYRLALLPGRQDGYVHHFGSFHMVLYYYSRGLLRMLPGAQDNLIDMAPADWAAETVLRLYFEAFAAGRTFHVCSAENAVTMKEFVSLTSSLFSQEGSRAPLELVEVSDYEEFVRIAERQGGTFSSRTRRVLNSTVPHTILSKSFDRSGLNEVFGSRFQAPHFRDYYPKIVRYCLSSDWGRLEAPQNLGPLSRPARSEVAIGAKAGST